MEGNIVTFRISSPPKYSKWKCQLFGGEDIVWRPTEGQEPSRFWRWMQYIAFGNRWVKDE